jgi:anti-anti-sigma factor
MTISKTIENDTLTLALEGKISVNTSTQLQEALIPALDEAGKVMLDFSNITFVASAGLRVLLIGQETANEKGVTMTLCGVSGEVMDVLDMTGFTDILTIV